MDDKQRIAELENKVMELQSIIDTHNLCHDLHGKVGQKEFEEGCRRETIKEFGSCGWATKIKELELEVQRLRRETDPRARAEGWYD